MAKNELRFSDVLEQRLIAAATKSRPAFSNEFQRRIMAAVDDAACTETAVRRWDFFGWRWSLLAASLAFAIASGWMIGRLTVEPQISQTIVAKITDTDTEVEDPAPEHMSLLDENMLAAADWLVDEVPIDLMLLDGADEPAAR